MPAPLLTLDQRRLKSLRLAMREESDGKELRRDLMRNIRSALEPAVAEARSAIRAMPTGGSAGLPYEGQPLREAIASRIAAQVKLSGRSAGAAVKARRRGMPRGFEFAARRTNRRQWRRRVFGRDVWVEQVGSPQWFDDTMKAHHRDARAAVRASMDEMRDRIAQRVRRL